MSIQIDPLLIRDSLRLMIVESNTRCLFKSSKWASENLIGMEGTYNELDDYVDSRLLDKIFERYVNFEKVRKSEINSILYAQSFIANGEYQRCSHYLLHSNSNNSQNNKGNVESSLGLFLAYYSLYMAGEKVKEQFNQESIILSSPSSSIKHTQTPVNTSTNPTSVPTTTSYESTEISFNPFLSELYQDLSNLYQNHHDSMDSYLLYLFAVVSRDHNRQLGLPSQQEKQINNFFDKTINNTASKPGFPLILDLFIESLQRNPLNWSCWLELAEYCSMDDVVMPTLKDIQEFKSKYYSRVIITSDEMISTPHDSDEEFGNGSSHSNVPNFNSTSDRNKVNEIRNNMIYVMYLFFASYVLNERQDGIESMKLLNILKVYFPSSNFVNSQFGISQYTIRDYDQAQSTFESIRSIDPFRLDHLDMYSNILYVKELKAELSYLAHMLMKINRYSSECCLVIGNYYSLKGLHEKAIVYFTRALKLNSKCSSAWTLMGHECIELRNTSAAVQCYLNATKLNKLDYRAWYGIGQTYEMLHMFSYALYYYKKSTKIRSNDSRMWCAVGSCYQHLNNTKLAIQSYEYAVKYDETEGLATRELAKLYRVLNQLDRATLSYLKHWISLGNNYCRHYSSTLTYILE